MWKIIGRVRYVSNTSDLDVRYSVTLTMSIRFLNCLDVLLLSQTMLSDSMFCAGLGVRCLGLRLGGVDGWMAWR